VRLARLNRVRIYHRKLEGALAWVACFVQRAGKLDTFPSSHHSQETGPDVQLDGLYKAVSSLEIRQKEDARVDDLVP
jgi:hypothetical protein